ncbi:bifunctional phosphoribosylaminoimidazolecarboxamide formyltransferase/IMP cyclohydrolase [Companilactobacillus metriopterae]|uniref:bifunctional phosphoribosylaminoimidazolecarboxamide formyltransferase/IMP cyclohydrolase n=1 Tax=Companilactobacillus metriopterae TaxID=1909267 RepID=UPI00100BE189|nr:bifunctional phosphoribosylaminoimidazolecarboxamide formyltransferase/IMP cyclohydrolase [Companilactobacillus metriopterae]
MKRALISVSDKTNITEFAKKLIKNNYSIISTGGTFKVLKDNNIEVTEVSDITKFPEMLDGRVKTLHPNIHAGLLAKRSNKDHMETLEKYSIEPIDLVCVNLYPFKETIQNLDISLDEAIEQIDIGGPSMIRSASKNFKDITVIVDPKDYNEVIDKIELSQNDVDYRMQLACKAFEHTANYDSIIAGYFENKIGKEYPQEKSISVEFKDSLRYGENSHQSAAFYRNSIPTSYSIASSKQLNGKKLSYNNIKDADAAIKIIADFDEPCVVALKHMNPCGIGVDSENILSAWERAYSADKTSIFGGVIVSNREVSKAMAEQMHKIFLEIIIAPSFSEEAVEILSSKKNLRLLELDFSEYQKADKMEYVSVLGGTLVQEKDSCVDSLDDFEIVTKKEPNTDEIEALLFGQKVVKHVKSNAIVIAGKNQTLGIGAGQMNRIGSVEIALKQAIQNESKELMIMASDAFFPMDDCVEYAAKHGVTAIIQPGGSIKDQQSIDKANKYGISMIFTGRRHFKH